MNFPHTARRLQIRQLMPFEVGRCAICGEPGAQSHRDLDLHLLDKNGLIGRCCVDAVLAAEIALINAGLSAPNDSSIAPL